MGTESRLQLERHLGQSPERGPGSYNIPSSFKEGKSLPPASSKLFGTSERFDGELNDFNLCMFIFNY